MQVLVIPDIHLQAWIFDMAEIIMKAAETYIRCENGAYPEGSEGFLKDILPDRVRTVCP